LSGGPALAVAGALVAVIEVAAVLVLRAHYTMDVFAGAVTALWAWSAAGALAPGLDRWLAALTRAIGGSPAGRGAPPQPSATDRLDPRGDLSRDHPPLAGDAGIGPG